MTDFDGLCNCKPMKSMRKEKKTIFNRKYTQPKITERMQFINN